MAETSQVPIRDPLGGLLDIPLPAPHSFWPATWFAWGTLVILTTVLIFGLWALCHCWFANRHRREATAQLRQIELSSDAIPELILVKKLAVLVRKTALAAFPRTEVADLSGRQWLAFLDRSYDGQDFSAGVGRHLAAAPYQQDIHLTAIERSQLVALIRRWIWKHHA